MCATFTYHLDKPSLDKIFGTLKMDRAAPFEKVTPDIYPFQYAHVIVMEGENLILTAKRYALTPSWAKEEKVKWATYNARMKRQNSKTGAEEFIYQVPTWKSAFGKRHCLVPLNQFRESCAEGKGRGHIVSFSPEDREVIFAAGLFEDWVNVKTGEIISTFAIITTEPDEFIKEVGHDRSPVFLEPENARGWLQAFKTPKAAYQYLEDFMLPPNLKFELVRKLKSAALSEDALRD